MTVTQISKADPKTACEKHPAYDADYCPSCGTSAKIPTAPAKPAKKAPARKSAAKKTAPPVAAKKATRPMPEGFPVGLKVTSSRDGLTYEVAGPDRSSLYVVVRNAEGKRLVRSIKTLTPVKTRAARKPTAKK